MRLSLYLIMMLCLGVPTTQADTNIAPNCTVIYSLQRSAQQYVEAEAQQIAEQLKLQNIVLIDLNNWFEQAPYLLVSGRQRHLLREQYQLPVNINQAVVLNALGDEISRHSGSITLVSAILNCSR